MQIDTRTPYQKKRVFLVELVGLWLVPLILMERFKTIGLLRHGLMLLGFLYVIFFIKYNRINLQHLGLQSKNLRRSGMVSVTLSVLIGMLTFGIVSILPTILSDGLLKLKVLPFSIPVLLFLYVVFSVPLQEFLFRGFVITRMELLTKNKYLIIVVSALIFALAHLMFQSIPLVLFCFLAGLLWGWLFIKYRNLWAVQFSHALLGGVFIYLVLK